MLLGHSILGHSQVDTHTRLAEAWLSLSFDLGMTLPLLNPRAEVRVALAMEISVKSDIAE